MGTTVGARLCRGDQPQQLRNEWCMEIIQRASTFGSAAADPARRGTQPRSGERSPNPSAWRAITRSPARWTAWPSAWKPASWRRP